MSPPILQQPLPYAGRLDERAVDTIDLVVIHCTELPDLDTARRFGEKIHYPDSQTGNSGHYYIDRDGTVEQWVNNARIAHHVRAYNQRSLGIELVNSGRYPDWFHSDRQQMTEPYPDRQLEALQGLLGQLEGIFSSLRFITGHEELDREMLPSSDRPEIMVRRKRDPGPLFPWDRVLAATRLKYVTAEDL
ncbi:MAG: N-acetylmuramoyl-L-alanine amidase [Lysobacterales bacterium]